MEDGQADDGAMVGVEGPGSGSMAALRRLKPAISTMYDFVDRQIFITSSACACGFEIRGPSAVLRASRLLVGRVPLDPSVDSVV